MATIERSAAHRFGFWSALAATATSLVYVVAQLAEWAGWLGSAGGPNSASTTVGLIILLLPSLLLGSAFVAAMAALHMITAPARQVFSLAALAFAIIYATLTGLVYFVQLTFVAPRLGTADVAAIDLLLFRPYESFLFAIDLFGYSLMCVAMMLAAFALPRDSGSRALRLALLANGALFPFLALQMQAPSLIWIAALWAIAFPIAAGLLAAHFQNSEQALARTAEIDRP